MAASSSDEQIEPPAKKPRRGSHFDPRWIQEFQGIGRSSKGLLQLSTDKTKQVYGCIQLCRQYICKMFDLFIRYIFHGGRHDVTTHVRGKRHIEIAKNNARKLPYSH